MGKLLVFLEVPVFVFEFLKAGVISNATAARCVMLVDVVFLLALKYTTVPFFVVLVGVGLGVVASGEAVVVHVQVSIWIRSVGMLQR